MQRLGLFGGAFDPVHKGHIHAARVIIDELALNQLYFIPTYQPVHKSGAKTTLEHRLSMLELALQETQSMTIDHREIDRQGPSYSLLTMQEYRRQYPKAQLNFIIGSDALAQLHTWFHWREFLDYVNLVVVPRPDHALTMAPDVAEQLLPRQCQSAEKLSDCVAGRLYISTSAMLLQASTEIRQRIADGNCLDAHLDNRVIHYIQQHKLYQNC